MSNYNGGIKVYPTHEPKNSLKEENRKQLNINSSNENKVGLTYAQALELQKRIARIESELKRLEDNAKSKIVVAPIKKETENNASRKNVKNIKCRPVTAKEIQTYRGPAPQIAARISFSQSKTKSPQEYQKAINAYTKVASQAIIEKKPVQTDNIDIIQHTEKPSLWQRIKRAVKAFFDDEPEIKKENINSEYLSGFNNSNWGNNTQNSYKYNQFRQSIPKTTIKIDARKENNESKRKTEHVLDRYI